MLLNGDCVKILEAMYDHPENRLDEKRYASCVKTFSDLKFISSRMNYENDDSSYWGIKPVFSPYEITNSGKAYVETVRDIRKENAEAKKKAREAKIISIIALVISGASVIVSVILKIFF